MAKRRKQRVVLDITLNKPVAERKAVAFIREVLTHIDWNAKEYVDGLYCDRAEAKSYIHVMEGLTSQGENPKVVEAIMEGRGPTYEEVVAENTRLRAALAMSERPCTYCSLPANEWAKCADGFPGCARADDANGCPELGASMTSEVLRTAIQSAVRTLLDAVEGPAPTTEPTEIDF
jgi:hypothetical protein